MVDHLDTAPEHDPTRELVARYFHGRQRSRLVDELLLAATTTAPPGLDSPDGEPRTTETTAAALRLVPTVRGDLDRAEVTLIESIMDRGWTWEQLGAAYGERSKQAMQQHYRRKGGRRSWPGTERLRPAPRSIESSPHRLTAAELDPKDVEVVRAAIAHLMATTYDVAGEHVADGAWAGFDPEADVSEQIATIGLEVLPRLEVACRAVAEGITAMVDAAWNRRDPDREARRRLSWTERLKDSQQDLAQWLERAGHGVPRVDRPLVLGQRNRVHDDHVEVDPAHADDLRAAIDHTLIRLRLHRDTVDQVMTELGRRQAELTPPESDPPTDRPTPRP
ncbi:hypothetical protein ABZ816_04475 [Actinosynnema sp. NPDC047251]|nr:hypothetical protein [Saccharothrix espanaensis]